MANVQFAYLSLFDDYAEVDSNCCDKLGLPTLLLGMVLRVPTRPRGRMLRMRPRSKTANVRAVGWGVAGFTEQIAGALIAWASKSVRSLLQITACARGSALSERSEELDHHRTCPTFSSFTARTADLSPRYDLSTPLVYISPPGSHS